MIALSIVGLVSLVVSVFVVSLAKQVTLFLFNQIVEATTVI